MSIGELPKIAANNYTDGITLIGSRSSISQPLTTENRMKIEPGPTNFQVYLQSDERIERIRVGLQTQHGRSSTAVKEWEASWKKLGGAQRRSVESKKGTEKIGTTRQ